MAHLPKGKIHGNQQEDPVGAMPLAVNCNEDSASWLSRLFFCWVTPLIVHGWRAPIQSESLPEIGIGDEMSSASIAVKFKELWAKEVQRTNSSNTNSQNKLSRFIGSCYRWVQATVRLQRPMCGARPEASQNTCIKNNPQPSLVRVLFMLVSRRVYIAFFARLVTELTPVLIPVLVRLTTTFAQRKRLAAKHAFESRNTVNQADITHILEGPPDWHGYVLVLGMFAMLLLYSWSFQWFFFEVGKATVIVRSALISAIYRKSLVLSAQARSRLTLGKMTNLISTDIGQIERGVTNFIVCITIPIQVVVSIVMLVLMIGPSSIGGWALVLALVPIQMWAAKYLVRMRGRAMRYTDKRIRVTREALQGIKVVKAFAWESSILDDMQRIRAKEVSLIARLNLIRYSLISFALHSPVFAAILTFTIYVLAGGILKNGPVFAVIGIFNSMAVPLSWLPAALTETRNTTVPLERITSALLEEELEAAHEPCPNPDLAVRVSDGAFTWESQSAADIQQRPHTKGPEKSETNLRTLSNSFQLYKISHNPAATTPDDKWQQTFRLCGINLEIKHKSLVIVIGPVGSGKSSLASALAGEMRCVSGSVSLGGSLSYAPQTPWVMNASIRANIVFGKDFDAEKYADVIEACSLEADIAALPAGDQTIVGERGVTLSGGQKQRISIARAAYSDSDISLLDDCLSAVDIRTSRTIFKSCIRGLLVHKTCILVASSLEYLSAADLVITMCDGRIVEHGSFNDLMTLNGPTSSLYKSFVSCKESKYASDVDMEYTADSSLHTATPIKTTARSHISNRNSNNSSIAQEQVDMLNSKQLSALTFTSKAGIAEITAPAFNAGNGSSSRSSSCSGSRSNGSSCSILSLDAQQICKPHKGTRGLHEKTAKSARASKNPMSQEERVTGQVSWSTYLTYIRAGGGMMLFSGIVLSLIITQACRVGSDFWIRLWTKHRHDADNTNMYIGIYVLFGCLQLLWFVLFTLLLVVSVYISSKQLHARAFERVLRSPMSFFDVTPLGRILNRFTRDIDSLDMALCDFFRQFYQNIGRSIGAFVTISIVVPVFLAPLAPLLIASWSLVYVYLRTSVEIQRVAAIARSPLYAHYAETLQGLATIRVYKSQSRYIHFAEQLLDNANRPHWYSLAAQSWVWLRVDFLSHLLTLAICLIIVAQPLRWDAAAVGMMLVQATQMGSYATYAGRGWSELQNNMSSVERIDYYATSLTQEPGARSNKRPNQDDTNLAPISMRTPSRSWPERGTIIIRGLTVQYRPGLPLSLDKVDMEVYDGEKIGIIGRSGAGKSSIVSAIFRLVEPSHGKVFIDGVDTQILPLERLRKSVGLLPQDPILFEGTLRTNLDPFHEFSDSDIWEHLRLVHLYDLATQHPAKLEMLVQEGGENLSVGQRQLLCLVRVLLRRPRVLILDEATANVDQETDNAIQRIIFSSSCKITVISIAHRLQTIIAYNRLYVIDGGKVVESGTPLSLLERHMHTSTLDANECSSVAPPSAFYRMVQEMDDSTIKSMLAQAQAADKDRHCNT